MTQFQENSSISVELKSPGWKYLGSHLGCMDRTLSKCWGELHARTQVILDGSSYLAATQGPVVWPGLLGIRGFIDGFPL